MSLRMLPQIYTGLSDWSLLLAVVIAPIIGFLTSFAFSRTTGIVTATASLALIFILQSVLRNLNFVGGALGILNIPRIGYLPIVIWVCVFLVGLFVYRIDNSRIGRALEAVRTDPDLAKTLGMNLPILSVFVMTISSVMGALAGVFYAFAIGTINPDLFGFLLTTQYYGDAIYRRPLYDVGNNNYSSYFMGITAVGSSLNIPLYEFNNRGITGYSA